MFNKIECLRKPVLTRCCVAAANSMGTLINGADAGMAIITSAVSAANATLIRAHQLVGQVDTMANEWAHSPIGSIVGQPRSIPYTLP